MGAASARRRTWDGACALSWREIDESGTQARDTQRARKQVIRGVAIWTPIFAALLALATALLVEAVTGGSGAWFGFALSALIGLLSGSLALIHWRDLFSAPTETTGMIQRKWRKADFLFFFPGHYVKVGKRVFRVRKDIYLEMPEPGGWIYAEHYPHSNALVAWRPVPSEAAAEEIEETRRDAERAAASDWGAQSERQITEGAREQVEAPQFGSKRDE